jgi:hypothetical protein
MHASLITLAALWLPWTVLAFVATGALGRGALGPLDSTRYGLLTMGIHIRGVLALTTKRAGAFKVTPKDGVEPGGWTALQAVGLVTTLGIALSMSWALRVAAAFGVVTLPSLPTLALVITLIFGAWELGCILFVLGGVIRRRQLRSQYRFPVALQARIDRTASVVPVLDLNSDGLSFLSPVALRRGHRLTLLTRLPDTAGVLHDVEFPVRVESSGPFEGGRSRVGCRLVDLSEPTRTLLIGYCFVMQPAQQLGATWTPALPQAVGSDAVAR